MKRTRDRRHDRAERPEAEQSARTVVLEQARRARAVGVRCQCGVVISDGAGLTWCRGCGRMACSVPCAIAWHDERDAQDWWRLPTAEERRAQLTTPTVEVRLATDTDRMPDDVAPCPPLRTT